LTLWVICAFELKSFAQRDSVWVLPELPVANIECPQDWLNNINSHTDSIQALLQLSTDISNVLRNQGLSVQNYGANGTLRLIRPTGLPPEYTRVFWHGLPLNAATNGLADFSLFPAFMFDELQTFSAASSAALGSGAGGLSVALSNYEVHQDCKLGIGAFVDHDQMLNSHLGLRANGHISKFNYKIKIFKADERNEFRFLDAQKPSTDAEIQGHNNHNATHYLLEAGYHWKQSGLRLSAWSSTRRVNVPNALGSFALSDANQSDSSLRIVLSYKTFIKKWNIDWSLARFTEDQQYKSHWITDDHFFIDSHHKSEQYLGNLRFRRSSSKYKQEWAFQPFQNSIISTDYTEGINRETGINFLSFHSLEYHNFTSQIQLRSELSDQFKAFFTGSFIQKMGIGKVLERKLESEFSINGLFRRPTMNERFWQPGANPNLLPEEGWQVNGALSLMSREDAPLLAISSKYFELNNRIVWMPENGIWSPENLQFAKGISLSLNYRNEYRIRKVKLGIQANLTRTMSKYKRGELYAQAPYTPDYNAILSMNMNWRKWSLQTNHSYTSAQQTDYSGSHWLVLSPFSISNASLSYAKRVNNMNLQVFFAVDNVFNISYQTVFAHALPGRISRVGMSIYFEPLIHK